MSRSGARDRGDGWVEFEGVTVVHETSPGYMNQGAIRVRLEDGREEWIPKACVHEDSEVYKAGTEGKLIVRESLATEKGLT